MLCFLDDQGPHCELGRPAAELKPAPSLVGAIVLWQRKALIVCCQRIAVNNGWWVR
jgi:hypothetical protein